MLNRRKEKVISALRRMLRPVIRLCLENSIMLQDILEIQKHLYIELARDKLLNEGSKASLTRLSALTGVHRKDASRIHLHGAPEKETGNVTSKVIGLWREHPKFTTKSKRPRGLTYLGNDSEFARLVETVTKDTTPRAVLEALHRVGAVDVSKEDDSIKLKAMSYTPKGDPLEIMQLLAEDVEDLVEAVMANIESGKDEAPNYHAKSIYDKIPADEVEKLRKWLFDACDKFQTKCEDKLAKHDLDITPRKGKSGNGQVSVAIFTRTLPD